MRLVVFELSNKRGQVTVNAELVRDVKATITGVPNELTELIFDESDHLVVVGNLTQVLAITGFKWR
jgi:hypothetical protein